jgi:LmbE family N-acetylglucosaminyl deacetylase
MGLAGIVPEQCGEMGCMDQQASLQLVKLARRLGELLRKLGPEMVLTHPYEGGHPDHDATAFAVHAACGLLRRRHLSPPAIVEMTSYHLGAGGIEPGVFLPAEGGEVRTVELSEEEREFKRQLVECFPTQRETLKYFPIGVERFRVAPQYDFTRRPHPGKLFYEMHPWGMTGERFCRLTKEAMEELGIGGRI